MLLLLHRLQVWLRAVPHDAAAELPPLYAGIAAMPCPDDRLLGCAMLDLSALHVLGSIEGWYNVTDEEQQLRGQLKVQLDVGLAALAIQHAPFACAVPSGSCLSGCDARSGRGSCSCALVASVTATHATQC